MAEQERYAQLLLQGKDIDTPGPKNQETPKP